MSSSPPPPSRRLFLQSAAAAIAVTATSHRLLAQPKAAPAPAPVPEAWTGDPTRWTLHKAAEAVRTRRLTAADLTEACLRRIAAYDRGLNAFITVAAERARAHARVLDTELRAGKVRGPLHGVPIALKDNIDTAGIRTTAASALFADRVPTDDAEVVRRLLAAGAVIIGKTNLDEFAAGGSTTYSYFGPTHNPWRADRNAGGSSGGNGAAVAAELCFGAIGTDTGGSIRIPASVCGIVGIKPTYGRVSNRGTIPFLPTRDHVGTMARTVEDAALLLQAIAGYDPADLTSEDAPVPDFLAAMRQPVSGLRLGVPRASFYDQLEPEIAAGVEAALGVLRKLTASMREVVLPAVNAIPNLVIAEAYAYHQRWLTRTPSLYHPTIRKRLEAGAPITAADYAVDQQEHARARREIRAVFRDVDLLITPTTKLTARPLPDPAAAAVAEKDKPPPTPEPGSTAAFNVYGLPVVTVPCGFTKQGLPFGVSISGPHHEEGRCLALARAYEQATAWHTRRPEPPRT